MLKTIAKYYLYTGLALTVGFLGYELVKDVASTPTYDEI